MLNKDLEWVAIQKEIESTTKGYESATKKLIRKCKENPLVPLGIIFTCAFFFNGLRHLIKQDSIAQNKMMRGRIVMQGLTAGVIVASDIMLKIQRQKAKEQQEIENFVDED